MDLSSCSIYIPAVKDPRFVDEFKHSYELETLPTDPWHRLAIWMDKAAGASKRIKKNKNIDSKDTTIWDAVMLASWVEHQRNQPDRSEKAKEGFPGLGDYLDLVHDLPGLVDKINLDFAKLAIQGELAGK